VESGGGSGGDRCRSGGRGDRRRAAAARGPTGILEFSYESQTTQGMLLFICSKISEAILN
jgi:hypothetical protein